MEREFNKKQDYNFHQRNQQTRYDDSETSEFDVIVPFTRIVHDDCRKLKYRKRTGEFKKPLHWGQRKLLLSEIEFLTLYGDRSNQIVYVGAADGKHILYLSKLFPKHSFTLYDPNKFDQCLYGVDNITIKQQLFTDEDALAYKDKGILLISDIRNLPEGFSKNMTLEESEDLQDDVESNVKVDMEMQQKWYLIIKPLAALFKFRLPYNPGKTEYLVGEIRFQAWAPATSTETRLVLLPTKTITKIYDNEEYESMLYRFNICTRVQNFDEFFETHEINKTGIYKSYDLAAEVQILYDYLVQIRGFMEEIDNIDETVVEMIKEINNHLGKDFRTKYSEKKIYYNKKLKFTKPKFEKMERIVSTKAEKARQDRELSANTTRANWSNDNIENDSW